MTAIPKVFPFQTSVETVRAHHWRYFTDAYTGCAFNCQYCLYKGPDDYGSHVRVSRGAAVADASLGILDIGSSTDPYQPIEVEECRTRGILEAAVGTRTPVFLLTRGTLVARDIDVLQELAAYGLIEVCMSIITLNQNIASKIEPRAPSPRERLATAERLAGLGLPVTFHVAPLIPGLDSAASLTALGRALGSVSGRHVFSAMLGAQRAFWPSFYQVMGGTAAFCHDFKEFVAAYPQEMDFSRESAATCELPEALPALMALRAGVQTAGATFVSENYPYLSTGALDGGIYRWKLPTAYDIAAWITAQGKPVGWADIDSWYAGFTPASVLVDLVRATWDSGELLLGTRLARTVDDEGVVRYHYTPEYVSAPARRTLVTRRGVQL
jgi:DNA repair photolyase